MIGFIKEAGLTNIHVGLMATFINEWENVKIDGNFKTLISATQ
jgi:hypothetical protein